MLTVGHALPVSGRPIAVVEHKVQKVLRYHDMQAIFLALPVVIGVPVYGRLPFDLLNVIYY